jgi:hypothetical protein
MQNRSVNSLFSILCQLLKINLNIYLNLFLKSYPSFLIFTFDKVESNDSLLLWVLMPDSFLIFLVVYFLLYISFYNRYSFNLVFNK